jgi:8-oxo-dGTP pyrophosphatase MutT (NUDIX family)
MEDERKEVVTCFLLKRSLEAGDQILLLRRSLEVGSYQERWAGVSGYLEADPLAQAYREIAEEVGLSGDEVHLLRTGEPLSVDDEQEERYWLVHPFLFEVLRPEGLHIDWEHTEAKWVAPKDLAEYATVPKLAETLARVYSI